MAKTLLLIVLVAVIAGCSYRSKARTVSVAELGNPDATRIHNYMSTRGGENETFMDSLLDEAVIVTLDPQQACFDLTVRSTLTADVHPSQWEIEVNGRRGSAIELAEKDSSTWTSTVTSLEVVRERTTARGTTTVTAPVEREVTRGNVVRYARACGPSPGSTGTVKLRVVLPSGSSSLPNWGGTFEWNLVAAPPATAIAR
jgi:hypothetical protein